MNVYIVGAGAVGTYLGEQLQRIGNSVTFAPRDAAAAEPLDIDLAIVAVKSYDTDSAIAALRRALRGPGAAAIMTPQNGVGNEEKLAAAFGADNIVAAALTIPVGRDKEGRGVAASTATRTTGCWRRSARPASPSRPPPTTVRSSGRSWRSTWWRTPRAPSSTCCPNASCTSTTYSRSRFGPSGKCGP
jgi:ketopantoate reductase